MASFSIETSGVVECTVSGVSNLSSSESSTSSTDLDSSSVALKVVVGVPLASPERTEVESTVVVVCSLEIVEVGSSSTREDSDNDLEVSSGASAEDRLWGDRSETVSGTFVVVVREVRSGIVVAS